ncbi:hypothetical protein FO519_000728 [Halicephalobus sp. NKZ332]|nr:hypothetical protein FO519_000728 [Halicephalobus sp. NKZ332]
MTSVKTDKPQVLGLPCQSNTLSAFLGPAAKIGTTLAILLKRVCRLHLSQMRSSRTYPYPFPSVVKHKEHELQEHLRNVAQNRKRRPTVKLPRIQKPENVKFPPTSRGKGVVSKYSGSSEDEEFLEELSSFSSLEDLASGDEFNECPATVPLKAFVRLDEDGVQYGASRILPATHRKQNDDVTFNAVNRALTKLNAQAKVPKYLHDDAQYQKIPERNSVRDHKLTSPTARRKRMKVRLAHLYKLKHAVYYDVHRKKVVQPDNSASKNLTEGSKKDIVERTCEYSNVGTDFVDHCSLPKTRGNYCDEHGHLFDTRYLKEQEEILFRPMRNGSVVEPTAYAYDSSAIYNSFEDFSPGDLITTLIHGCEAELENINAKELFLRVRRNDHERMKGSTVSTDNKESDNYPITSKETLDSVLELMLLKGINVGSSVKLDIEENECFDESIHDIWNEALNGISEELENLCLCGRVLTEHTCPCKTTEDVIHGSVIIGDDDDEEEEHVYKLVMMEFEKCAQQTADKLFYSPIPWGSIKHGDVDAEIYGTYDDESILPRTPGEFLLCTSEGYIFGSPLFEADEEYTLSYEPSKAILTVS